MARALAIETSSRIGSVAASLDGNVLAEEQFEHGLQHAANILPMIDRLCRAQRWTATDLDELYVSAGPGSFTGLRIGVTLAKTLALATGVKLVAVPTMHVLAQNAPVEAKHLVLVLDAKRDQVYTARFERADSPTVVATPASRPSPSPGTPGEGGGEGLPPRDAGVASTKKGGEEGPPPAWHEREPAHVDSLAAIIERTPRPLHLLGEGIPSHEKFIPNNRDDIFITPADLWRPRASVVARIGFVMARKCEFTDPDRLTPIYIRRPEAEEKWDAMHRR